MYSYNLKPRGIINSVDLLSFSIWKCSIIHFLNKKKKITTTCVNKNQFSTVYSGRSSLLAQGRMYNVLRTRTWWLFLARVTTYPSEVIFSPQHLETWNKKICSDCVQINFILHFLHQLWKLCDIFRQENNDYKDNDR